MEEKKQTLFINNIYAKIFFTFLRISFLTFGGGHIMIPFIKKRFVDGGLMSEHDFVNLLTLSQTTPGPVSINLAINLGFHFKKVWGSFFALLGIVLPSLIVISLLNIVYTYLLNYEFIVYLLYGMKIAFAIIILETVIIMFKNTKVTVLSIVIASAVLILLLAFLFLNISYSSIYFILASVLLYLVSLLFKRKKK